jgi:putative membrane-bound dehydrogenase-like protein
MLHSAIYQLSDSPRQPVASLRFFLLSSLRDFYDGASMENGHGFFLVPNFCGWFAQKTRGRMIASILSSCCAIFAACTAFCADQSGDASNAPPASAPRPNIPNPLPGFRVQPGFRIEQVAAEPTVEAPVAMAFDENGRLFVAEMRDDPNRRDADPHLGRIRMLEGMDDDGVFHNSTVYADDLAWPSALACYAGGVFVAATPDIIYLKDSKGDGVADIRKVVLTGFGGTNTPSVRSLLNNFKWGLDNRIHGAAAGLDGIITASNWPSGPVSISGSDFSFDPRSLAVFPETGPSQSGLSFDQNGRRFTSDFARPLRLAMHEQRYVLRNPYYMPPPGFFDVASPATPLFRASSSSAAKPGTNGLSAVAATNIFAFSWLTNAHGCLIYRGSAFLTNYLGNAFIADPSAHVVHRLSVRDRGLEALGERPPEERQSEFVVCTDPSFSPVQVAEGPDGAIYIVDMQDSRERGRIYRIVPANFKRPKPGQLGRASTYELVAALAGNDGWHWDSAARLLYEKADRNAVRLLGNMLSNSRVPLARLHALCALQGLGALQEADVLRGLRDSDARVREHAVLLAEGVITNGTFSDLLWGQLKSLAGDPSIDVRYQLAFSVAEFGRRDKALVLGEIVRRDPANRWIRHAVLSSLAEGAGDLFVFLASDPQFLNDPVGNEFLRELARMIGLKGRLDEVRQATAFLVQPQLDRLNVFGMLAALGEGLRDTRSSLVMANPQGGLERFFSVAMETAIDSFSPPAVRIQAVRLTGVSSYTFADTSDWLLMLCNPGPWPDLRVAAINAVAHYDDPRAVTGLLDRWQTFPPFLRTQAIAALLGRRSHVALMVEAIERGRLPATDLSSTQRDFLRTYNDPAVSERAVRIYGPLSPRRPTALDLFRPSLKLRGVRERGQTTFVARCSGCHQLGGVGQVFGPSLVAARPKGRESILTSIIEPSAEVPSRYATCVAQTYDGDNLIGISSNEELGNLTLRQPGGGWVIRPHVSVGSLQFQSWSLMPEGLEQGLSTQDMADLLEYIMTAP